MSCGRVNLGRRRRGQRDTRSRVPTGFAIRARRQPADQRKCWEDPCHVPLIFGSPVRLVGRWPAEPLLGGAVLLEDLGLDAAARADLDVVRHGPGTHRLRVDIVAAAVSAQLGRLAQG